MATSSFFYNGSNAPEDNPNTPLETTGSTENPVKTSFFYQGVSPPNQTSVEGLLNELDLLLAQAQQFSQAAYLSASQAQAYADNAAAVGTTTSDLLNQSNTALSQAQTAQASAESVLLQINAAVALTTTNKELAQAAQTAAEAAKILAQTAATNAQTSATNAATSATAAAASATTASGSATSAANSASGIAALIPSQTGNSGKYLKTNGTTTSWAVVDAFPSQTGNAGKYLTTNGTTTSWATVLLEPASYSARGLVFGRTDEGVYAPPTTIAYNGTVNQTSTSLYADTYGDFIGGVSDIKSAISTGVLQVGMQLTITCYHSPSSMYVPLDCGTITALSNAGAGYTVTFSNEVDFTGMMYSGSYPSKLLVWDWSINGNIAENVTLGQNAGAGITTGGENVIIGTAAGNNVGSGRNNVVIGNAATASAQDVSNEITLGNSSHTKTRLFGALALGGSSVGTAGQVLTSGGAGAAPTWSSVAGTVTSVNMSVPTGLSVSGNPVTTSGTLAVTYASGYSIPTDAKQTNWDTAYGWGNHASAGYLTGITGTQVTTALGYTPYNSTNPSNYITTAGARSAISVSGSLSYNSTTGVISYTQPTNVSTFTNDSGYLTSASLSGYLTTSAAASTYVALAGSYANPSWITSLAYSKLTGAPTALSSFTNDSAYVTAAGARTAISVSGSLSYNNSTGVISYTTPNTDSIAEGTANLYFTNARARAALSAGSGISYNSTTGVISSSITQYNDASARASISASGSLSYNSTTGVMSYTTPSTSGITEGSNLYYTDARARAAISVSGNLSYNSTTGVLSYTQPTYATVATSGSYADLTSKPTIDSLVPTQTGNAGEYLTTNGTTVSWGTVDALPSQTGNSGKYLTTDGSAASWATIATTLATLTDVAVSSPTQGQVLVYDTTTSKWKNGSTGATTRTTTEATATAGQTVFTVTGGYTVGLVDVFVNGAQLQSTDYTATNGTTVTLATACVAGDDVRLVAWGTYTVAGYIPFFKSDSSKTTIAMNSSSKLPFFVSSGTSSDIALSF